MVKTLPESLQNGGQLAMEEDDEEENKPKVEVVYIDYGNTEWVPISRYGIISSITEKIKDIV